MRSLLPKIITCKGCGDPVEVLDTHVKFCMLCKDKHQKEYHKVYNRKYKQLGWHKKANKRAYTRTVLKNAPGNVDEQSKYCRDNHHTIEGCLNCICDVCIQPEKSDDFLIWEKEGEFYEDKYPQE